MVTDALRQTAAAMTLWRRICARRNGIRAVTTASVAPYMRGGGVCSLRRIASRRPWRRRRDAINAVAVQQPVRLEKIAAFLPRQHRDG